MASKLNFHTHNFGNKFEQLQKFPTFVQGQRKINETLQSQVTKVFRDFLEGDRSVPDKVAAGTSMALEMAKWGRTHQEVIERLSTLIEMNPNEIPVETLAQLIADWLNGCVSCNVGLIHNLKLDPKEDFGMSELYKDPQVCEMNKVIIKTLASYLIVNSSQIEALEISVKAKLDPLTLENFESAAHQLALGLDYKGAQGKSADLISQMRNAPRKRALFFLLTALIVLAFLPLCLPVAVALSVLSGSVSLKYLNEERKNRQLFADFAFEKYGYLFVMSGQVDQKTDLKKFLLEQSASCKSILNSSLEAQSRP